MKSKMKQKGTIKMKWPDELNDEIARVPGTRIRIRQWELYDEVLRHGYAIVPLEWNGFLKRVLEALSAKLRIGDPSPVEVCIPNGGGRSVMVGFKRDIPIGSESEEDLCVYDVDANGMPIVHIDDASGVDFYNGTKRC